MIEVDFFFFKWYWLNILMRFLFVIFRLHNLQKAINNQNKDIFIEKKNNITDDQPQYQTKCYSLGLQSCWSESPYRHLRIRLWISVFVHFVSFKLLVPKVNASIQKWCLMQWLWTRNKCIELRHAARSSYEYLQQCNTQSIDCQRIMWEYSTKYARMHFEWLTKSIHKYIAYNRGLRGSVIIVVYRYIIHIVYINI